MPTNEKLKLLINIIINQDSFDANEFRELFSLCGKSTIKHRCTIFILDIIEQSPELYFDMTEIRCWLFGFFHLWDMVQFLLKKNPQLNVDIAPTQGLHQGQTLFWMANFSKRWDVVRLMLQLNPNPDATPANGCHRGKTAFWLATINKEWGVVFKMLEAKPNLHATPVDDLAKDISPYKYVSSLEKIGLVKIIWEIMSKQNTVVYSDRRSSSPSSDTKSVVIPAVGLAEFNADCAPVSAALPTPLPQKHTASNIDDDFVEVGVDILCRLRSPLAASGSTKRKSLHHESKRNTKKASKVTFSLDDAVRLDEANFAKPNRF